MRCFAGIGWSLTVCAGLCLAGSVGLEELELEHIVQGWGMPVANQTIVNKPLTMDGVVYERGLGSHAPGVIRLELDGSVQRFSAVVGVDDETDGKGSVSFRAYADGNRVFDSGVLKGGDAPREVELELDGVKRLVLLMLSGADGKDFDHADWARATFSYSGRRPRIVAAPEEQKVVLTPPAPESPRINGPSIYGVRPGRPFLYRIPCTGERPMEFSAEELPEGLSLDTESGIVRGTIIDPGHRTHTVRLVARNAHGRDRREFRIVVGDTLALTPPMGWNSWYIHYNRVSDVDMRAAAAAMIESGMADYGYQYVNIDDCWMKKQGDEPYRDKEGAALPNAKFPDMKGMVDYIHSLGLKAGLYTSPGPWTCARYVGAYQHEKAEVDRYVAWEFDFLKYDWCSYGRVAAGSGRDKYTKPYVLMGNLLKQAPRDVLLNLCQYGMGNVWEWGREVGGHCSRTTGDLGLHRGGALPGFYHIGLSNAAHHEYAGPGYWNDPDYILIGWVGAAHGMGEGKPTTLTGNEQYSYMSMWCLMAAPLIFSGDMTKLDPFTLNVLCNREVIDVDQDPLGRQARIVRHDDESLVMLKPMQDGSLALGLFNLAEM